MENEPLSIPRRMISKDENIQGMILKIRNDIEILFNVINVFNRTNVNLMGIVGNLIEDNREYTTYFLILNLFKSNKSKEEIFKEINSIKGIMKAEFLEKPSKNLIIDTYHYPLIVSKKLIAFILPENLLSSMILGLVNRFGKEIGQTVLFYIGREFAQGIIDIYNEYSLSVDEIVIATLYAGQSYGLWKGKINLTKEKENFNLILEDNFECRINKQIKLKSVLIRGLWEKILSLYFEEEIKLEEVKCIAFGDNYCEFKIIQ